MLEIITVTLMDTTMDPITPIRMGKIMVMTTVMLMAEIKETLTLIKMDKIKEIAMVI